VQKLIQRLTGHPINVPKTYIDNLNVVVLCSSVRLPNGRMGRRITNISEIVDFDPSTGTFSFVEVFQWDSSKDIQEFLGLGNSYVLEYHVARKRGLDARSKQAIYNDLERRAKLFQKLHESGKTNFYDLYTIFSQAEREGLT
jgi:flagellar protein FlaI